MKRVLFGLGIGIGLGVLFAPVSGEEARNNLTERANDLANSARESYEQGRDRVQRGVEAIRATAGRAIGQARSVGNDVLRNGGDIAREVRNAFRATGTEGPSPSGT